tara:strand:+ start:1269 stop:2318 length:1050 start_codon:yes stop_codon:yes gene_type:complete
MKISIGTKIKEGPWGGGNLFAINLSQYLLKEGHKVFFDLNQEDLDVILITEPRKTSESSAFTNNDVLNYKKYVNNNVAIIHRINECDERKGTNYINSYLLYANRVSDHTIFVSEWLKNLFINLGINKEKSSVILAGANNEIFNDKNFIPWDKKSKIRIVTHHWGGNWNKGFEIYKKLDELLDLDEYRNRIEFNYIGNLPNKFEFKNTNVSKPLSGKNLAQEIKKSHLYLTGSLNEPSGNHHIEGGQCGLPILYINSGGIPEYCDGYGEKFTPLNFEIKLEKMIKDYDKYLKKMKSYPFSSNLMSEEYMKLFNKLVKSIKENKEGQKEQKNNFSYKLNKKFYLSKMKYKK